MKKILFMIPNLGQGGAEKVLVNLLNNLDKTKYDITVKVLFDDKNTNKVFLKKHIHYEYCFKKTFRANSQILKLIRPRSLYKHFIKEHYDYIVSYLEGATARIIAACPDKDTKKVCWIHVEQHGPERACYAFRNYKEARNSYDSFNKIIPVSHTVLKDFQKTFNLDESKLQVIYNTNESKDIIDKSNESIDVNFDKEKINLIGVARFFPVKRFDRYIRITRKLIDEGYDVHAYLLGDGPERGKLRKLVDELDLKENFTFLGYQINPYKYISNADLFVCCSTAEGFNTAATEALIVGTPVITTLVSGMKEMLGDNNEYGIITENDEDELYKGIKDLLDHKEKLHRYAELARERGEFFSTENTVRAVEKMFEEL